MSQTEIAPGLTLGPIDPDNTSELTKRVGVHNHANALLKRHTANFPDGLRVALARPLDVDRTKTLDLEEVESALRSLSGRRAFFKSEDVLEDASVRGTSDRDRVVSVVFRKPDARNLDGDVVPESGRVAQGVIPYVGLERSAAAHEDFLESERAATPHGIAQAIRQGENAPSGDSSEQAALLERLEALETATREAEERARVAEQRAQDAEEQREAATDPEPYDGYAKQNAGARVKAIKEGGIDEFGRTGLERIRAYEESHDKYATVLDAIEDQLAKHPDAAS